MPVREERFLVGAGGGRDILSALVFRQKSIVATEVNEDIVKTVNDRFGDFTGHLDHPSCRALVPDEARSFLARDQRTYDAIQISFIDTWAATASGASVPAEHQLYTVEAFSLFLKASARRHPQRLPAVLSRAAHELYRVTAGQRLAASDRGRQSSGPHVRRHPHLRGHALVVPGTLPDGVGVGTVLIGRDPFSEEDLKRLSDATTALLDVASRPRAPRTRPSPLLASADDPSCRRELPLNVSPHRRHPSSPDDPFPTCSAEALPTG
jgi:hypothetical protein